jgi:uncharacterized repeat protein (TIGR01451 family)
MMFSKSVFAVLLSASAILAAPAAAQEKPVALESKVQLMRPAEGGGEPQLVEPDNVVPGDMLLFTTSFHNEGAAPVTDFVVVNPVADSLELTAEAAGQTDVSVDGGKSWGPIAQLKIVDEMGQERPATIEDITHMRWKFAQIRPGETGRVQFIASVR